MADEEEKKPEATDATDEDLFALDDLDDMLEEEVKEAEGKEGEPEEDADADQDSDLADIPDISEEEEPAAKARFADRFPKIIEILNKIIRPFKVIASPFEKVSAKLGQKLGVVCSKVIQLLKKALIYLKTDFPDHLKFVKSRISDWVEKAIAIVKSVRNLRRRQQLTILLLIGMGVATLFLTQQLIKRHIWIPSLLKAEVKSLENVARSVTGYDQKKDMVLLYNSFTQPYFTFLLDGIVVNLQRSMRSTKLPMVRVELYFNLDSTDTAIEFKHRKLEIKDHTSRLLEEMSYDELISKYGKKK